MRENPYQPSGHAPLRLSTRRRRQFWAATFFFCAALAALAIRHWAAPLLPPFQFGVNDPAKDWHRAMDAAPAVAGMMALAGFDFLIAALRRKKSWLEYLHQRSVVAEKYRKRLQRASDVAAQ